MLARRIMGLGLTVLAMALLMLAATGCKQKPSAPTGPAPTPGEVTDQMPHPTGPPSGEAPAPTQPSEPSPPPAEGTKPEAPKAEQPKAEAPKPEVKSRKSAKSLRRRLPSRSHRAAVIRKPSELRARLAASRLSA